MKTFDVIIIGTGAGGSTLAYALADTGKTILLIERGDFVPREPENWNAQAVLVDRKYRPDEFWRDQDGQAHPASTYYCVGGNTKFYGAGLMRFRERDFGTVAHHGGTSPAWPVRYEDFEPYYAWAEHLYHVHGSRGVDPTEPPASVPYRHPSVPHEPRIRQLFDDFRRLGLKPFPMPLGLLPADDLTARGSQAQRCIRCATCGGYPCQLQAKADAETVCLQPLKEYHNVSILTGAFARRLETSGSGREVSAVVVDRRGETERYGAGVVVVACGAINSAALLLRSASARHPDGLANGSGVVGRHYMRHNNTSFIAMSRAPNPTVFQKTFGLNDFYAGAEGWPYPMGNVQLLGKSPPALLRAEASCWPLDVEHDKVARHGIDFCVISEDLPHPRNRVALDAAGCITLSYTQNNLAGHLRLVAVLQAMMGRLGCEDRTLATSAYIDKKSASVGGANHQCGTIRFGHDPASSALNSECRAHEVDNLYVVDASFFPSSAAVNPALTVMANALRVGDHLRERLC